jgi:hypothetical protein
MFAMRRIVRLSFAALFLAAPLARSDDGVPAKALESLKAATVYVTVESNGTFVNSGFVCQADAGAAFIASCSISVDQLKSLGKLSVVVWPGTENEKSLPAEILMNDVQTGLAVLKITAKDLPRPLELIPKLSARETMTVYTFGYPPGQNVRSTKQMKIAAGKGFVSRLFENDRGQPAIQVDGQLYDNHKGGPVTDAEGRLIGIAASGFQRSASVIPTEALVGILNGRVVDLVTFVHSVKDGVVELEVEASIEQTLNKVQKVELRYVQTSSIKDRQPKQNSDGTWSPLPDAKVVPLKLDGTTAKSKISFKSDDNKKKRVDYSFQGVYVNAEGKSIGLRPIPQVINFGASATVPEPFAPAPGVGEPTGKDFVFALNIGHFLAAQIDLRLALLVITTLDGTIRAFDYPSLKLHGDYRLAKDLAAYQAVIDGKKGLLYAAVAKKKELNPGPMGFDHVEAGADILVFDVSHLEENKGDGKTDIEPVNIIRVGAKVRRLLLAPDGTQLYFVEVNKDGDITLVRVNTETLKRDGDLKLAEKTDAFCLTPDGKTLYATAPRKKEGSNRPSCLLQIISVADMKITRTAELDAAAADIVSDDQAFLYLSGGWDNNAGEITVVQLKEEPHIVLQTSHPLHFGWLATTPDGSTLYLASRRIARLLHSCPIPETFDKTFMEIQGNGQSRQGVGGPLYVSPDGRCVLCTAGGIFWTAAAKAKK